MQKIDGLIDTLGNLPKSPTVRSDFAQAVSRLCQMLEEQGKPLGDTHVRSLIIKFANHCANRGWAVSSLADELPTLADAIGENTDGLLDLKLTLKKMVDLHRVHNCQAAADLRRSLLADPSADAAPKEFARSGGYRLVECLTQRHLQEETASMGHCVGGTHLYYYRDKMARGTCRIFSLRTSRNIPVCTIEYDTKTKAIVQMEAKRGFVSTRKDFHRAVCRTIHALGKAVPIGRIASFMRLEDDILTKDGTFVSEKAIETISFDDILCGAVHADNATPAALLSKMCAFPRLMLDVTNLDLSRLPAHIECELVTFGKTFDAPRLQVSKNIHAESSETFHAPALEMSGDIHADNAAVFKAPKLRRSGDIHAELSETFHAPNLEMSGDIYADSAAVFKAPKLLRSGDIHSGNTRRFVCNRLHTSGDIHADRSDIFKVAALVNAGDLYLRSAYFLRLPRLKKGTIHAQSATRLDIPNLETAHSIYAWSVKRFNAPKLKSVCIISADGALRFHAPQLVKAGDIDICSALTMEIPRLENAGDIDAGSALNFKAPNLKTALSIRAQSAKTVDIPQLLTAQDILADSATAFRALNLDTALTIHAYTATRVDIPRLKTAHSIVAGNATHLDIARLEKVAPHGIRVPSVRKFIAPQLKSVGKLDVYSARYIALPVLTQCGDVIQATSAQKRNVHAPLLVPHNIHCAPAKERQK